MKPREISNIAQVLDFQCISDRKNRTILCILMKFVSVVNLITDLIPLISRCFFHAFSWYPHQGTVPGHNY